LRRSSASRVGKLRKSLEMDVFNEKTALLITDMIHDFIDEDGALHVPGAKAIVPRIAELAREARAAGAHVIYINDTHDPDDSEFKMWPEHAVRGSRGSAITEGLEPEEGDHVIEKTRYSGFFETQLDDLLKRLGVNHVVITGTVTNICVLSTATDASMRGYMVSVPADAVAAFTTEDQQFTFKQVEKVLGGKVIPEKEG
jgi:nicotinamidase/pyrazinamidase